MNDLEAKIVLDRVKTEVLEIAALYHAKILTHDQFMKRYEEIIENIDLHEVSK